MVEKSRKTVASKEDKRTEKDEETVVKNIKKQNRKITGAKAACVNAIGLSLSLFFGLVAVCDGIAGLIGWHICTPSLLVVFDNLGLFAGLLSVICALLSFKLINKITDRKMFERTWRVLCKVFSGLGIFAALEFVSNVLYAFCAIGSNVDIQQSDIWLNSVLPELLMTVAFFGISCLAKKILTGKTVLVRIFGILSIVISAVGTLLVIISCVVSLHGGNFGQEDYSDYKDVYFENSEQGIDLEDLYDEFFSNPYGF